MVLAITFSYSASHPALSMGGLLSISGYYMASYEDEASGVQVV